LTLRADFRYSAGLVRADSEGSDVPDLIGEEEINGSVCGFKNRW
jgi:hypothetical protein